MIETNGEKKLALAVFSNTDRVVVGWTDKKGAEHYRTPEGALFAGGLAMVAMKDIAQVSAFEKVIIGRYREAAEIVGAGFPSIEKSFVKLIGSTHANKANFKTFLKAVSMADTPKSGAFSKKQVAAQEFMGTVQDYFLEEAALKAKAAADAMVAVEEKKAIEEQRTVEA